MNKHKTFLHIDMDAFFASIEQLDHPEWKGKPVIVSGNPHEPRGVVSTASYEARKFGIHSAMPAAKAIKLCPNGIFTPCRMKRYSEVSEQIIKILQNYSPDVEQLSIDEACLDLTGTEQLFGPPEQTALKIKDEIFFQTGLTVSVGLASSRYLSKLASEINKPNGFFQIPFGKEEEFILELPLKKIWGIGEKTLEKLHSVGIFTTKQLHQKDENILQLIFGKATGSFLYNTVRAKENGYREIPSSHSISSETTFTFDLKDRYTIETAILQLCESINFRLLSEKVTSRTVMLKIRYDDFSTFSVQETTEDYITSVDDIFARAKKLFDKKYEFPKGIRLLGISVENIIDQNQSRQQVLFDFGEKKKQAVENAILNIKTKHPELKIKKARLLDTNNIIKTFIPLVLVTSLFTSKIHAEETFTTIDSSTAGTVPTVKEFDTISSDTNEYLFNYKIKNNNLKLFMEGWWQAALEGTINSTYSSKNGFSIYSSLPIFKQEIDLSLLLKLNDSWYFNTEFADEFNKNTISLGYENDFSHFKISNRGIAFPNYYSAEELGLNIGGGQNQAPGIGIHIEDNIQNKWKADFALRYNFTKQKEATFYGKNSVIEKEIKLNEFITGKTFTLPHSLIGNIKEIYVENSKGNYTDEFGVKYNKLSSSEYLILPENNQIIFSSTAQTLKTNDKIPHILIEFSSEININSKIGTFQNKDSYLGKIQEYFGSKSTYKPDLEKYSYDFNITMNNKSMLKIQSPAGFSPFMVANEYDLGEKTEYDVTLINEYSSTQNNEYKVALKTNEINFVTQDFLTEHHAYAEVYSENSIFNFPLADKYPEFYLNLFPNVDLILSVKKYTPISRFDIGTDIAENSVKVYKNGILDSSAKYDKDSGTVILSSQVNSFDKIYITWQEDTSDSQNGSISGAAGFFYNLTPNLHTDVAFTTNWPVSPSLNFADSETSAFGFVSLSGGISFKTQNISISDKIAASFESQNTTGIYSILGMDWNIPSTHYIQKSAGYTIPKNILPIINDGINQIQLKQEQNFTQYNGTETDSKISGYKVPIKWNFPEAEENCWAAVSINLDNTKELLSAQEFLISVKNEFPTETSDFDVFLQLGVLADSEIDNEESDYIPTWKISDSTSPNVIQNFDETKTGWQIVKIKIQEEDLIRFSQYRNARIIVFAKNSTLQNQKGTISIGPYEIITQSFFIQNNNNYEILSKQEKDNSIKKYETYDVDDNYVQEFSWKKSTIQIDEDDLLLNAYKYFEEVDLSNYKTLNFSFKYKPNNNKTQIAQTEQTEFLKITLDRNFNTTTQIPAVELQMDSTIGKLLNNSKWNKITIDLESSTLYINDSKIQSNYKLRINKNILPTRFAIQTNTCSETIIYEEGSFYIDELTLEDSFPYFMIKNKMDFIAEKKGTILQIKNYPVIENANIKISSSQSGTFNTNNQIQNEFNIDSLINANVTVAKTKISSNLALDSLSKNVINIASHTIDSEKPILKSLYLSDSFIINEKDSYLEKYNKLKLDLSNFNIPLQLLSEGKLSNNDWKNEQTNNSKLIFDLDIKNWNIYIASTLELKQNTLNPNNNNYKTLDYFNLWTNSLISTYSTGNENSTNRNVKNTTSLRLAIPYLNFSPEVVLETSGKYNNLKETSFNDKTVFLMSFPLKIKQHSLEFSWKKEGGEQIIIPQGGTFIDDIEQTYQNNINKSWFIKTFPFSDIFNNSQLHKEINSSKNTKNSELQFYSSEYKATWKRPIFANMMDLWIPSNFTFNFTNDIRTSENSTDIQQIKFTFTNTPFNLFGSESDLNIFKWYKTEEIITSFTSAIKIPKDSDLILLLATYTQINFYLNNTDILNTAIQFQFKTDNNWKTQGTVLWKRQGKTSLLSSLIDFISRTKNNHKINRLNSFDFLIEYDSNKNIFTQEYEIAHKIENQVKKNIFVNMGLYGNFSYNSEDLLKFSISASVGGKIDFQ